MSALTRALRTALRNLLACSFAVPAVSAAAPDDTAASLAIKAKSLADKEIMMPIEESRLAAQFATLAGSDPEMQADICKLLMRELFDHPNFHVRRVGVNGCRRIGRFDIAGLDSALVARLSDPHPWVRYDAAWAVEAAELRSPEAIQGLLTLAAGTPVPTEEEEQKLSRGDAQIQSRVRAAKALEKLRAGR